MFSRSLGLGLALLLLPVAAQANIAPPDLDEELRAHYAVQFEDWEAIAGYTPFVFFNQRGHTQPCVLVTHGVPLDGQYFNPDLTTAYATEAALFIVPDGEVQAIEELWATRQSDEYRAIIDLYRADPRMRRASGRLRLGDVGTPAFDPASAPQLHLYDLDPPDARSFPLTPNEGHNAVIAWDAPLETNERVTLVPSIELLGLAPFPEYAFFVIESRPREQYFMRLVEGRAFSGLNIFGDFSSSLEFVALPEADAEQILADLFPEDGRMPQWGTFNHDPRVRRSPLRIEPDQFATSTSALPQLRYMVRSLTAEGLVIEPHEDSTAAAAPAAVARVPSGRSRQGPLVISVLAALAIAFILRPKRSLV